MGHSVSEKKYIMLYVENMFLYLSIKMKKKNQDVTTKCVFEANAANLWLNKIGYLVFGKLY